MMKKYAKTLLKNPLIHGSAIVVLGGLFANVFNFLFNIFMLRNLSTADYGVLATVIAIVGYPAIVTTAIGPLIIRFAGEYFAKNKIDMVRGLYLTIFKLLASLGLLFGILFLLGISSLSQFFHISDTVVLVITSFIIFITFIGVINYPFMQAKLSFTMQVITTLVNALSKLVFGVIFVFGGLATKGAVLAVLIASIFSYIVSFIPLRFIFNRSIKTPSIKTQELFTYGIPSAITFFSLNSFITSDIILIKHLFEPHQAGLYAGISLVGRVIFFMLYPISTVMFPLIVQKHAKNENFTNTFKLSLVLVFLPAIFLTLLYTLFPEFILMFFTGGKKEYLELTGLIGYFGLFISLYTVLNIVTTFYLSIKKTNVVYPVTISAVVQVFLIYFFHNSFFEVIVISLVITFLLVVGLLLYYPHATKK